MCVSVGETFRQPSRLSEWRSHLDELRNVSPTENSASRWTDFSTFWHIHLINTAQKNLTHCQAAVQWHHFLWAAVPVGSEKRVQRPHTPRYRPLAHWLLWTLTCRDTYRHTNLNLEARLSNSRDIIKLLKLDFNVYISLPALVGVSALQHRVKIPSKWSWLWTIHINHWERNREILSLFRIV